MAPLPPIDDLEVGHLHPLVLNAPFVDLLVLVELRLPFLGTHWGQRAGYGAPFRNAEAAVRKARQATHCDHYENKGEKQFQPEPDGAARIRTTAIDQPGLGRRPRCVRSGHFFEQFTFAAHRKPSRFPAPRTYDLRA